jgi:hemerythrin-like metal-binding protein
MNADDKRHVLGFPEMDSQHDYCYRLFDAISPVAATGDTVRFGKLLHEIEMYVMFHFECEEHLMRLYEFPGFGVHQSDHEQLYRRMIPFLDDFDAGALNPSAYSAFLIGWLMEHSAISDSEYVKWILQRRSGESSS